MSTQTDNEQEIKDLLIKNNELLDKLCQKLEQPTQQPQPQLAKVVDRITFDRG